MSNPHHSILPLRLDRLTYIADDATLLDDVTLTVAPGSRVIIVGPNGAGKSLLLRLCHGLLVPTSGNVIWSDGSLRPLGQAMVFQRPVMLRRSVRANLDYVLNVAGMARKQRSVAIDKAMTRFGLADLRQRSARLLSGGEQQRLALARAWLLHPEILFLDEPTSALDPGATKMIEEIICGFNQEGMTIVMATHNLGQARRLAEKIAFFHRGRLLEYVSASSFFNSPSTPEARAFIEGDLLW